MDIKKENEKLINFWNEVFKNGEPTIVKKDQYDVSIDYHRIIKQIGDTCEDVLDLGCGHGYTLFGAKVLGNKMKYGLGIDPSEHAIGFVDISSALSEFDGITAKVGTHEDLKLYDAHSFDGIMCSNTLDVVPLKTREDMISEIKRLLKPNGLLLLKFNFLLDEALIEKIGMKEIEKNTYTINGIIRGVNQTREEWLSYFNDFELIEETTFDRVQSGPKDRVFLLKKKA